MHYTILNKKGKEVDAGIAATEMPSDVYNLNKIEKIYLAQIAEGVCSFVPDPVLEKTLSKKKLKTVKKPKIRESYSWFSSD